MMIKKLALALAITVPFSASAEDLSYSYLQAGATRIDVDSADAESGYGFAGSGELTENWHMFGSYRTYDVDVLGASADVNAWNVGFGYNMGISDSADFIGRVSYEKAEAGPFDTNGFGLEAGVRNAFTEHLEGGVSLKYVDLDEDNNTSVELYGQYKFGTWGIVGTVNFNDDGNEVFIGPRISF